MLQAGLATVALSSGIYLYSQFKTLQATLPKENNSTKESKPDKKQKTVKTDKAPKKDEAKISYES